MELQNLKYFITIASEGSFNRAAGLLFLSQPSLSKAIANLEKELNVRLFERHPKGVLLTENGKKLYEYATTVMAQLKLIEGLSTQEVPKTLRIASYPLPAVSTMVAEFYNEHNDDHIALNFYVDRLEKVLKYVAEGKYEIGIITANAVQKHKLRNILRSSNLEAMPLGTDNWYVVVGANSPLYNQKIVNMRELIDLPVVRFHDDYFSNMTYFLEIDGIKLTAIKYEVFVDDNLDIQNFLLRSNAYHFQLGINASYYTERGLHVIPIHNCDLKIEVLWIKQKKTKLSTEAEEFVDVLKRLFSEHNVSTQV